MIKGKTGETGSSAEICERIYGVIPPKSIHLTWEIESSDPWFAAGKATRISYKLLLDLEEKKVTIPFIGVIPKDKSNIPAIINLTSEGGVPNKYLPAEELIDRGYAIFSLCIDDVSGNDGGFKSRICGHIARSRRKKNSAGKISVWAWAIMRMIEHVYDLEWVNRDAIILAGHGILARAVMLAGGLDERVSYVIANGIRSYPIPYSEKIPKSSGTVRDFPYLYCPAFVEEAFGDEYLSLLSLLAPKFILIGSAEDGEYADPEVEYGYLTALSEEYYLSRGLTGLKMDKEIPATPMRSEGGEISYHIRRRTDYFSREDWNIYLDFIDAKINKS